MKRNSEDNRRIQAFGNQLMEVHVWLREQLADVQSDVESYLSGAGRPSRNLRVHCLSFCASLTRHHSGEDNDAFFKISNEFPELRHLVKELTKDHLFIDQIVSNIEDLLVSLPASYDADVGEKVLVELQGLTAIMETHFIYEEKKLIPVLNSMTEPAWRIETPTFLQMSTENNT